MTSTHGTVASARPPEFTIVMPTYNSSAVIGAALDSCINQGVSVEVLVIDGASKDGTVEIARIHPVRPIVVSERDKGIYDAVNKGIHRATGRLIGVVGSDDMLEPSVLAKLKALHDRTRTDIVFGAAKMVDDAGNVEFRKDEPYGPGALLSGIPFCHNAMFVTQDCARRVGDYNTALSICGDADWVHRAIKLGCTASSIPDAVVAFSLSGLSSSNAEEIMAETYKVIAANFDGVTPEEGKLLIEAVRRWGPVEPAFEIARRYPDDKTLQDAIAHTFRIGFADVLSTTRSSLRNRVARHFRRLFRPSVSNT